MAKNAHAAALIFLFITAPACAQRTSLSVTTFAVGFSPFRIAARDFDGDGKLDLVTADLGTGAVGVLHGRGDGTFSPPAMQATAASASSMAVADFNDDGKLDVAVSDANGISILLGNGDGTLAAPTTLSAAANAIAAGDINADGHVDLVLGASGQPFVATTSLFGVLLGNGDGTFGAEMTYPTTLNVGFVALGDVNGDGNLDLVASGSSSWVLDPKGDYLRVCLGNGDGTLGSEAVSYVDKSDPIEDAGTNFALGDFDGDAVIDLAAMLGANYAIAIFHGNGDGTFTRSTTYPLANENGTIEVADFDGDGELDLVEAEQDYPHTQTIGFWLGHGDGTFQLAARSAADEFPFGLAVGDFNGDGRRDVAASNWGSNDVTVLINRSVGR